VLRSTGCKFQPVLENTWRNNAKGGKKMKKLIILLALMILSVSVPTFAGPDSVYGDITSYTTVPQGLVILIDGGVLPDNCASAPTKWMIISQEDKAILAVALMKISQDRMGVGVYSDGSLLGGICRVNQLFSTD
jgi:hypothetical protein